MRKYSNGTWRGKMMGKAYREMREKEIDKLKYSTKTRWL